VRAGIGFDFVPRLPWNSVQISGKGEQLPIVNGARTRRQRSLRSFHPELLGLICVDVRGLTRGSGS
jgi:hypothetical protein